MADAAPLLGVIGGSAAGGAGAALGNAMGGSQQSYDILGNATSNPLSSNTFDVDQTVSNMNNVLSTALNNAINSSTGYTNQAVAQQNQSLNAATGALNTSLGNANNAVTSSLQNGFNTSQALQAPYAQAGYNALDSYEDSLGVARPTMGNAAYASALSGANTLQNQINPLLSTLGSTAQTAGVSNPYGSLAAAPTLQQANLSQLQQAAAANIGMPQAQSYLQGLLSKNPGSTITNLGNGVHGIDNTYNYGGLSTSVAQGPGQSTTAAAQLLAQNPNLFSQLQNQLSTQQAQQTAAQQNAQYQTQYNTAMNNYNPYSQAYTAASTAAQQLTPQQIQQLQTAQAASQGLFGPAVRTNV